MILKAALGMLAGAGLGYGYHLLMRCAGST
jgi:hypothetical protein